MRVTGEACPHHFSLTDECLRTFDSNFKIKPPLRTAGGRASDLAGLKDGTLDVLATDHAPSRPGEEIARTRSSTERHHRPGNAACRYA